jgi:hypothetical protein
MAYQATQEPNGPALRSILLGAISESHGDREEPRLNGASWRGFLYASGWKVGYPNAVTFLAGRR